MKSSTRYWLGAVLLAAGIIATPLPAQQNPGQRSGVEEVSAASQSQAGTRKRLLVITQSEGFVHEPVKRKITVTPEPDQSDLPKIASIEWRTEKGKGGAKKKPFYAGRMESVTPLAFESAADAKGTKFVATVVPDQCEATFMELGNQHGFDVVGSQDSRTEITAENLKNFDAVWFYTTGELPLSETQKDALLAFVRGGKGFGGNHSATDTFYKWKEYGDMIGAYFDGHPWTTTVNVIVEDKDHIATKHLGDQFTIKDEIYEFKGPYDRTKLKVLMHLDRSKGLKQGKRSDNDNALAWTNQYGDGRVFYTALGHFPEVWQDPRYQQHILGALRYLFRQDESAQEAK
jgi:uncharacterized protein